jgi:hypothetical protein
MTVLILLNILLMIFFALLGLSGSGGQNWFNKRSLEMEAIQDSTSGPSAEETPKNIQPLLEEKGINLNNPKNDVIYL